MVVLLLLLVGSFVHAEKIILPSGPRIVTAYDLIETNKFWDGVFLPLAGYKELVYLDVGALTVIEETTWAIGISANVPNLLSLIPGVTINLKDPITFGWTSSYNFRSKYWMGGLYLSYKL